MTGVIPAVQEVRQARFSVASYNIHRCIGIDGSYRPERITAVIHELRADLIGLQEVDSRLTAVSGMSQLDYIASMTRYKAIAGPCIRDDDGCYGNALLTRCPVMDFRLIDLSVPGFEPRGAIDVDLCMHGTPVRVIVTHLGRRAAERRIQIRHLLRIVRKDSSHLTIIMGDFNEWMPFSRALRIINSSFGATSARSTFPSIFPILALDRIWVLKSKSRPLFQVHGTPLSRIASDHLPLRAEIQL
ncbi:MAG: endonuclease/exonuclease/phosphatase family protein [Syntrophales bacterium]